MAFALFLLISVLYLQDLWHWSALKTGLAIAPGPLTSALFAAASTLPAHRATTGSAVLNMARQVGSAVGVAVLVALLATQHPDRLTLFRRGWAFELIAGGCAALLLARGLARGRSRKAAPEPVTA